MQCVAKCGDVVARRAASFTSSHGHWREDKAAASFFAIFLALLLIGPIYTDEVTDNSLIWGISAVKKQLKASDDGTCQN